MLLKILDPIEVLLVEDDELARRSLCRILTGAGCRVRAVGTIRNARLALIDGTFDLLVSDLELPDGDMTDHLPGLLSTGRITTPIAVSARTDPSDIRRGLDTGFIDYLPKPVDLKHLASHLDRCRASIRQK